jgi:hypothetical protein
MMETRRNPSRQLTTRLVRISYRAAIILLSLAYLPMFFGHALNSYFGIEFEALKKIYDFVYATLTCYGVGFLLITKKEWYLVPLISMFFVIGSIFLIEDFYKTFYPIFTIIISMLLCSFLFMLLRHKYN